jgi:hypothetical protein
MQVNSSDDEHPFLFSNSSVSVNTTPVGRAVTGAVLGTISSPGGLEPFPLATRVKVKTLTI